MVLAPTFLDRDRALALFYDYYYYYYLIQEALHELSFIKIALRCFAFFWGWGAYYHYTTFISYYDTNGTPIITGNQKYFIPSLSYTINVGFNTFNFDISINPNSSLLV